MASRRSSGETRIALGSGRGRGQVVGRGALDAPGALQAGGGMAASHQHGDAYMAEMYKALEEMGVDTADDKYKPSFEAAYSTLAGRSRPGSTSRPPSQPLPPGLEQGSVRGQTLSAFLPCAQ